MNFSSSSQRKSWIFSQDSLYACKQQAVAGSAATRGRVQKFASGFHSQWKRSTGSVANQPPATTERTSSMLSVRDQETLVQFHAHQIQTLVGPHALVTELRRSQKVLSTAVVLFRRFFLSNSVIEFNPRKIATAAAFLAAKLEEERVEISLLAHATSLVHRRVRHAPLCRTELGSISMAQIEEGERELMEGVNYEFICHHPDDMIEDLFSDVVDFLGEQQQLDLSAEAREESCVTADTSATCESPRGVNSLTTLERPDDMLENVMDAVNQTLIFSDAPFLFSPESIAYAVTCIETRSFDKDGHMGDDMLSYLVARYAFKSEEEILRFSQQVSEVISCLLNCQDLDLLPGKPRSSNVIAQRAEELRRVLVQVADLRLLYQMNLVGHSRSRKRQRNQYGYTPRFGPTMIAAGQPDMHHKMAKITPTNNKNTGFIY